MKYGVVCIDLKHEMKKLVKVKAEVVKFRKQSDEKEIKNLAGLVGLLAYRAIERIVLQNAQKRDNSECSTAETTGYLQYYTVLDISTRK